MKLTIAQTETLKALNTLGRDASHPIPKIVDARQQVRTGSHPAHFKKHWELMLTKTAVKLHELKELGFARATKDGSWCITVKGEKAVKEL